MSVKQTANRLEGTSGDAAELKSRLMARIQDELKTADASELHSYDKGTIAHDRYIKA